MTHNWNLRGWHWIIRKFLVLAVHPCPTKTVNVDVISRSLPTILNKNYRRIFTRYISSSFRYSIRVSSRKTYVSSCSSFFRNTRFGDGFVQEKCLYKKRCKLKQPHKNKSLGITSQITIQINQFSIKFPFFISVIGILQGLGRRFW